MKPAPMPLAIEYVNGMTTIVRNAGSAIEKSVKSMLADLRDHQRADHDQRRRGRLDRHHR